MAHFKGTLAEFHRYIGPCVRNMVQTITRPYKLKIGACENPNCQFEINAENKLQFAHILGRERVVLINEVLEEFIIGSVVEVDLDVFNERLKQLHFPFKNTGLVLCKQCHGSYDKKELTL